MIYNNISEIVGNTPLMELHNLERKFDLKANIYGKLEYFNPIGSVKDRAALSIIEDAEKKGKLKKGGTIIEATSGNTGIGLAGIGASRGYKVIIVMPDTMSVERRKFIEAYGAEVILSDGKKGMAGSLEKANEIFKNDPSAFMANQFSNFANSDAHYYNTAPEIYNDLDGNVDVVVAGIGTSGTISGMGKYLKEKNKNIQVIGVEPFDSPLISKGKSGSHKLQGIGANFIPGILNKSVIDRIETATTEESIRCTRLLGEQEGIMVGISSGAALSVGMKLANLKANKGKNIVIILPDSGDRYLSTELFGE